MTAPSSRATPETTAAPLNYEQSGVQYDLIDPVKVAAQNARLPPPPPTSLGTCPPPRPKDRVFDGMVRAITESEIVFSQEVNDPLSLVKQREVRKPLRALQEGK